MSQNLPPNPAPGQDPNQPNPGQQYGQPGQMQYPAPGQPGQAPEQGSRYGTTPYAQQGQYGAPVERPAKMDLLLKLTLGSLVLWVLSSLVSLIFPPNEDAVREQVRSQMEAAGIALSETDLDTALAASSAMTLGTTLVVLVLGIGLYLLVYLPLRKGKNWARILGIVLAILGIAFSAFGFSGLSVYEGPGLILAIVLSALFIVVNIVWLITAFNKGVAAYTRAQSEKPRY
ncbi:hypothetical protein [Micrococcus terreus]|uniref:hypothetical protein n=1 Tax=Micrococcus terreus TaxID=574650 RepID=UPI0023F83A55|nr:hypothetical protein [Micrococcus terreus]